MHVARVRMSVTMDEKIVKWVDEQIRSRRFRNTSHALEGALAHVIEEERKSV